MSTDKGHKKKLIYLMHVSWYWIRQRPHFLAIQLSEYFDTTILYPKSLRHANAESTAPENCKGIFQFPFSRFGIIKRLNRYLYRQTLKKHLKMADILWTGHPEDFSLIKDLIPASTKIIYDCMDDLCEFPGIKSTP